MQLSEFQLTSNMRFEICCRGDWLRINMLKIDVPKKRPDESRSLRIKEFIHRQRNKKTSPVQLGRGGVKKDSFFTINRRSISTTHRTKNNNAKINKATVKKSVDVILFNLIFIQVISCFESRSGACFAFLVNILSSDPSFYSGR